jgi:TPR repeat protein
MEDSNNSQNQNSNQLISMTNKKDEESNENSNGFKLDEIFSINEKLEEEVKNNCGIPNWGEMIFGLFDQKLRKKLLETSKKNMGYYYFILGITKEYGIDTEIDYELALKYYQKAANLKECFALYKLYILYTNQYEIFKIQRNREKEIYFLLQSIAFSDSSFFMNNDTFFKIDIFYEINLIFDLETNLVTKLENLFKNLEISDENRDDILYLESIIQLKFLGEKHNIDVYKQYEIFEKIQKLAGNMHLESCYKLACIYRQSKYK